MYRQAHAHGLRLLAFPAGQGGFAVESLVRLAVLLAVAASLLLTVSRSRSPFASLNMTARPEDGRHQVKEKAQEP